MKAKPFSFFLKTTQSLRSLFKYVNFKNLQHYINLLNKIFVRVSIINLMMIDALSLFYFGILSVTFNITTCKT